MKRFTDTHRRLFAYIGMGIAVAAGFYMLGPVAEHNRCVAANRSRAELKESFHIVISGLGDPDQIAELDRKVQRNLAKGLPQRECDNTVIWPFTTFTGATAPELP